MVRATWEPKHKAYLLDGLIDAMAMGKSSDSGFKKEAWENIKKGFNEKFETDYQVDKFKTQFATLKGEYQVVKRLKDQSGFGWDSLLQIVTASEDVWTAYITSHQEAKKWKGQPFPHWDKLHDLCEGKVATGVHALVLG